MDVFRSVNNRISIPLIVTGSTGLMTSVVYIGPAKDAAVVVWTATLVGILGSSVIDSRFGVRVVGDLEVAVNVVYTLRPVLLGGLLKVSGSIVVDLRSGDLIELFGGVSTVGNVMVEQNGFVIRVM
jgi:hypothetical protein